MLCMCWYWNLNKEKILYLGSQCSVAQKIDSTLFFFKLLLFVYNNDILMINIKLYDRSRLSFLLFISTCGKHVGNNEITKGIISCGRQSVQTCQGPGLQSWVVHALLHTRYNKKFTYCVISYSVPFKNRILRGFW